MKFKFLQTKQERQPIIPTFARNNFLRRRVFLEGWEAAKRGEHAIRTRDGGNPYTLMPLKNIWLKGWRQYFAGLTFNEQ